MVDVGAKTSTLRVAVAEGCIDMEAATLSVIKAGTARKGDVLGVARIAAIQAAKRTESLIPLCHQIPITGIEVTWDFDGETRLKCRTTVRTENVTGVEMEALTGVAIGLLTVYDMCKAIDRGMTIGDIRLIHKEGGRSGIWDRR